MGNDSSSVSLHFRMSPKWMSRVPESPDVARGDAANPDLQGWREPSPSCGVQMGAFPLQETLAPRREGRGQIRAFRRSEGLVFINPSHASLTLLSLPDKPTLDESGCPGHQTWLEGTQQQLACEADGNPMPEVSCRKGSQVYDTGSVQNVTRGHAGVYRCSATSVHGTAGRNVTIHVECKGRDRSLWGPRGADGPAQLGSPVSGARGFQCLARSDAVPANARRVRRRGSV